MSDDNQQLGAEVAVALIGDKWTLRIIDALRGDVMRYGEIQRRVKGISQRMLIHTLRNLERDGLVERKVYAVVPPKTEYSLTPLGKTLLEPLRVLCLWAQEHSDEIRDARERAAGARDDAATA